MSDECPGCGHAFDPHGLFAPDDPLQGGVALCQEENCRCFSTWAAPGGWAPAEKHCGFCNSDDHRSHEHPDLTLVWFSAWMAARQISPN